MSSDVLDPRIAESLDQLKGTLLHHPLDDAVAALNLYLAGLSIDAVARATSLPPIRIAKWIKAVGISRSREQIKAMQRRTLDQVRHLAVTARQGRYRRPLP